LELPLCTSEAREHIDLISAGRIYIRKKKKESILKIPICPFFVVRFINDELKMMQAFLRAADGARENIGVLKAYLDLIRDMACDIEDCLEEFMVFIKHKNYVQQLLSLGARHRIAAQIRALKQRVQEMSQRNLRYNLIKLTPSTSSIVTGDTELARNFTALNVEEAQLVGLDEPKKKLTELIAKLKEPMEHETSAGPRVVSLVGMGGLGKTALAKKVYDSKDVSDMFGTRAWITVSQSFDQKELFKEMIMQLFGSESWSKLLEEHNGQVLEGHLATYLSNKLKKTRRYLIVLDDVWTIEAWNRIKITFQYSGNDDNCVVVTTRNGNLAEYCSHPSNIHRPEFLGKEEATTLFLKKTNKSLDDLEKDKNTKGIVEKILNKCGGLPLAILTIGGLLANKDTEEWESIYKQLPWDLATNPSLDALRRVVSLSYSHLPSHLKPCFLHLSIFPEDFEVEKKHLVNRWVAEGFIADDSATRTHEEVSENYFYELISRCMIQPSKFDSFGKVKTCRIHDIVHDIAVSISRQENYVFILGESTSNITTGVGIRHLSCIASRKLNMDLSRVRSFTVFSEPLEPISLLFSSKFKMLRILDLKNAPFLIRQKHIRNIGLLPHLKYLHFHASSFVHTLPRSIGNLRGLMNLDVRGSYIRTRSAITTLPAEITKLQDLRCLRCCKSTSFSVHDTTAQ
jgi:disease resistance protein RPM1